MGRRYGPLLYIIWLQLVANVLPVLQEIEEENATWTESRERNPKHEESTPLISQAANLPAKPEEPPKPTKSKGPTGFY